MSTIGADISVFEGVDILGEVFIKLLWFFGIL
jgi:hypothetical protein